MFGNFEQWTVAHVLPFSISIRGRGSFLSTVFVAQSCSIIITMFGLSTPEFGK